MSISALTIIFFNQPFGLNGSLGALVLLIGVTATTTILSMRGQGGIDNRQL